MKRFSIILLALIASASLASAVTLTWSPNAASDQVTSYKAYEHVGATYNLVGTITTGTTLVLTPPAGTHAYVVTAVNATGESPYSNEASTAILGLPSAPTNLQIK
jgi:flagellar basal body-associated protein FliL